MKIKQIEGLQAALDQAGTGTTIGAGKREYSTTTSEPPSSGQLRLNHATPGSATEAYVHDSDGTTDWSGLLNKGDAGSILKVVKDESNYWMFDITGKTDETGYVKYTISPLVIVGTISNEDEVTIELDVSEINKYEPAIISLSGTGEISIGEGVEEIEMPFAGEFTSVGAFVIVSPTGSGIVVDIEKNGTSILSTLITIDAGDTTSRDATNQPVISTASFAEGDIISFNIDQVGASTPGEGLKVFLNMERS